ncbi:PAS domain-containing protein [Parahaliea maris]|uniref:PAS domain-containing protein n=1 Tax=Parahaliea maris TaxID=2716870 RepID=A0A5C8ZZJ7_9GAMM|nr:sigma 54-interacting transcriptional regulator [Parahaliea maris]TXS94005.1 PAS domain-containing protein [Parahaliea maris]
MLIATDSLNATALGHMLEGFDCPAILVASDYRILATNTAYREAFGELELEPEQAHHCFRVSHGYDVPCDQAGEACPLAAATSSGHKERVLHVHETPRGREHVDVEMLPIYDARQQLQFFVELLKPVPLASGSLGDVEMVGSSAAYHRMLARITRVGPTDASVLLLGESGTGKELAARAIHMASARKHHALVTLECSGLTDTLFESELFGHVKGAFTGAHSSRKGLVELADGGTLFLDEIGDVPLHLQVKLLRLLETGTFRRVGSTDLQASDFRLVCATHRDLPAMVEEGSFRSDLYYRINVFPIHMASLEERRQDIPQLAQLLLKRLGKGKKYRLTESAVQLLCQQRYRGNIRELRNLLQRALVMSDTNLLDRKVIAEALLDSDTAQARVSASPAAADWVDLKTAEARYLQTLMAAHGNDKSRVAEIAGISLRSLYRKLDALPEQD